MGSIIKARNKIFVEPIYLLEISLLGSGAPILYFSDRNITVDGHDYENYLESLSNISQELSFLDSTGLNANIELQFKNEAYLSYSYLIELNSDYPFAGAACTVKEFYIEKGGIYSDRETIFIGVCEEPRDISLLSFNITLSNKVTNKDETFVQKAFNIVDYPNVSKTAIGRMVNTVGYGSAKGVRASGIVSGAFAFLDADISETDTSLVVTAADRFPSAPFDIQIEYEQMTVTSKSGTTFQVLRAQNKTEAELHYSGQGIFEVRTEYVYHLFDSPVDSISKVYIDGKEQRTGFTAYTGKTGDEHPDWPGIAVITFTVDPYIGQQRNLTDEEGSYVEDPTTKTIYPNITPLDHNWGASVVSFPDKDYGDIQKQWYSIEVKHESTDVENIIFKVAICNKSDHQLLKLVDMGDIKDWAQEGTFSVAHDGGEWGTIVTLFPIGSSHSPWTCPVFFGNVYKIVSYYPTIKYGIK